jgi:hypothetical protein
VSRSVRKPGISTEPRSLRSENGRTDTQRTSHNRRTKEGCSLPGMRAFAFGTLSFYRWKVRWVSSLQVQTIQMEGIVNIDGTGDDGDLRVICSIKDEQITQKALKTIQSLSRHLRVQRSRFGMCLSTTEPITENDRCAWENIIMGIVFVM